MQKCGMCRRKSIAPVYMPKKTEYKSEFVKEDNEICGVILNSTHLLNVSFKV